MSSLDHIGIKVADFAAAKAFYEKALAPLGITALMVVDEESYSGAGFGRDGKPDFWISAAAGATSPIHIAFSARSSDEVDAFYDAAMAAGAKDNGAPGLRPLYHPNYYGAFVIDPDGHNVEAVFHGGISG
ncbi:MAG: VOC family protein [Alphaproteobacteria bacterium]|nr:VOC family protein [Alphaproteobacteria bacterium]